MVEILYGDIQKTFSTTTLLIPRVDKSSGKVCRIKQGDSAMLMMNREQIMVFLTPSPSSFLCFLPFITLKTHRADH